VLVSLQLILASASVPLIHPVFTNGLVMASNNNQRLHQSNSNNDAILRQLPQPILVKHHYDE